MKIFQKNILVRIRCISLLIVVLGTLLLSACSQTQQRPNVVILMTDDQGYGDLSVYGNPHVKTPNLDKLHDVSIRFTNFHVAPACTPTRSQLMTGIDAMHTGAFSAHGQHHLLNRNYKTLTEVFAENGYKTALYGKWHLGGNSIGYRPHERGFDDAVYFLRGGHWSHPNPWNSDCMDDTYYHNGKMEQYQGYSNDIWFDLGKTFIKNCKRNREPFFCYLPVNAPHLPWLAPEKYRKQYLNSGLDKESINFFAMISSVDERLGDLLSFLKKEELWENTIFIFLSDNGSTLWQQEFNAGMRGKKASEYEGGHRVPLFISWPNGKLDNPRDIEELTEVQDLFPTLIDLCNLQLNNKIDFEGINITPLLKGEKLADVQNRIEVVQFHEEKHKAAIMHKNWRLVYGKELYDISNDPAQENNIADNHPEIVDKLLNYYEGWWKEAQIAVLPEPYFVDGKEEIMLTAYDWYDGPRIYNWPHLRRGDRSNGKYRMVFQQSGKYNISLRRWPREANAGITDAVPAFMPFDDFLGELPAGKALNIVKARIKVGEEIKEKSIKDGDKEINFQFEIKNGETHIQTWFIDKNGEEFGAYYMYIKSI